jgi:hypothetical protein
VPRLLDEGEDVGDALVGIRGGDVAAVALENDEPRIGNELLVLPRLLDRLHFASVSRHYQSRGFDTPQNAVSRQVGNRVAQTFCWDFWRRLE